MSPSHGDLRVLGIASMATKLGPPLLLPPPPPPPPGFPLISEPHEAVYVDGETTGGEEDPSEKERTASVSGAPDYDRSEREDPWQHPESRLHFDNISLNEEG